MSTNQQRQRLARLRDEALQAYLDRDPFTYDVNADALYRQYKDRYVDLGRAAMTDTMGQAAALTGGYGSSYAQNVGQQAYHRYLKEFSDVVPRLYQLAYDRYQDQSEDLYRTYEQYALQEQQAAQAYQWEQEQQAQAQRWEQEQQAQAYQWEQEQQAKSRQFQLELALSQQRLENDKQEFEKEYALKKQEAEADDPFSYYQWVTARQGSGKRPLLEDPDTLVDYDNGKVTTGNVMTMQRLLGLPETGMWTVRERASAGGMNADDAWRSYQIGKLQGYAQKEVGDVTVTENEIKIMERALRRKDDGVWDQDDYKAAGYLTPDAAWLLYQQGKLSQRNS